MNSRLLEATALAVGASALVPAYLRWLRVGQREHYLPGSASRFARRWWGAGNVNRLLVAVGLSGAVASIWYPPAAFASAVAAAAGPLGLSVRGRTSPLAWTSRLRRLSAATFVLVALPIAGSGVAGLHPALTAAAICAMGAPAIVDLALWLVRRPESRLLRPYVDRATERLRAVAPRVVAITGSYGKTTTKGYVAHLVGGSLSVVASPASFNNTVGLARAINEHLATGTQVFVAEMGTYGPGEIASMCAWLAPEIAIITAIGPVHLERMGTLERIAESKAEILQKAQVAILNVDYPLLADLAQKAEEDGKTVWCCSAKDQPADVTVSREGPKLRVRASHIGPEMDLLVAAPAEVEPGNVACAIAAALSLGVPAQIVASRLNDLPSAPHRRSVPARDKWREHYRRYLQCQSRGCESGPGTSGIVRREWREKSGRHPGNGRAGPGTSAGRTRISRPVPANLPLICWWWAAQTPGRCSRALEQRASLSCKSVTGPRPWRGQRRT